MQSTRHLESEAATFYLPSESSEPRSGKSIDYAQWLIRQKSITPVDADCQVWLAQKLAALGFECHRFEDNGVSNLVATLEGKRPGKTFAFAGHTDVVPPGPLEKWSHDPFAAELVDGVLYGRGAADMKTGVAAMLGATERFVNFSSGFAGSILWLITSDEEGEAEFGSKSIQAYLNSQNIVLDYCIVAEPTAINHTGDAIKVGRRGALSGRIKVLGKQGHVAYPQYADNAIHKMGKVIQALNQIEWDAGSDDFPGTHLQITHINSGDFTDNIVPAECGICFNIRYSHRYSQIDLESIVFKTLEMAIGDSFNVSWERPCEPYFTAHDQSDSLIAQVEKSIHKNTGKFPVLSTAGGTSDGRFFANDHTQVVEVGVPNRTIHQINERIDVSDLVTLEDILTDLLSGVFNS